MVWSVAIESLIAELVAIESVNPDLVATGSGETAISGFVASWLRDAGLEVEIVEPVPGRPSVVGVLHGTGGGRSLMLNAHMDTVGAGGMADAFLPVVRDGRVYGRGAYDMKASLAAIMITAREAAKSRLRGDLIVTAVSIQSSVGGNLARILDGISHTIRQRVQMKAQISALTAQMRASGWIITLLPFIVAAILNIITPTYFGVMFTDPAGRVLLVLAGISIFIGNMFVRRITNFRV